MKSKVVITVLIAFITFFRSSLLDAQQKPTDTSQAFVFVAHNATFQGGSLQDFRSWVQGHLIYPPEDLERGISDRVTVPFVINKAGRIINAEVLHHATPTMDAEAKRVILSSPTWEPAKQDSILVSQEFTIPVAFIPPE